MPFQPVSPISFKQGLSLKELNDQAFKYKEFANYIIPCLIDYNEYTKTIRDFINLLKAQTNDDRVWLNNRVPQFEKHFNLFLEKKLISPGSQVAMWGDIHGSLHSLLEL